MRYRSLLLTLVAAAACARPAPAVPATATSAMALLAPADVPGRFDITAYGAVPLSSDVTLPAVDSRPAIAAAVNAACAAGGGEVYLPAGRWWATKAPGGSYNRFSAVSAHCPGVRFVGAGKFATTLVLQGDAGAATFIGVSFDPGCVDCGISDLTIDSRGLFNTDGNEQTTAIVVGSGVCPTSVCDPNLRVENTSIERVRFFHGGPPGVRWGDCVRVGGNTEIRNTRLMNLDFLLCGRSGVEIQRMARATTVSHNYFAADAIGGTPIDGEATGGEDDALIVSHNQIMRFKPGPADTYMISLTSQSHFTVDHNVMLGVGASVGKGCVSAVRVKAGTISGNICDAGDATATTALIDLANVSTNVIVSGNVMHRAGGVGYCVKVISHSGGHPGPLTITDNQCWNETDGASFLLMDTSDTTVSGNTVVGSGTPNSTGFYASPIGRPVEMLGISDNNVRGAAYAAVRLAATGGYGFVATTVEGNRSRMSGPLRCDNIALSTPRGVDLVGNSWWGVAGTRLAEPACSPP